MNFISIFKHLTIYSLILSFSGCVPKGDENAKAKLLETPNMTSTVSLAATSEAFDESWPASNWWAVFQDENLNALIETGIENNPTIAKARTRIEEARALANKEKAKLFPQLHFNAQENWQYFSKSGQWAPFGFGGSRMNLLDIQFLFNLDLDIFGKNRKTYYAALGKAKADQAEAYYIQLLITGSIASSYFSLKSDMLKVQTLEELKVEKQQLLSLTEQRKLYALDNAMNVAAIQEEFKAIEIELDTAKNQVVLDRHFILALLGKGPDESLNIGALTLPEETKIPFPKELSLELLSRRADLMAEIWKVRAAAEEVGAAKAAFYPNINLMALGGLDSLLWNKLFNIGQSKNGYLLPAISFPLFTGGELTSNLKAKRKAFEETIFAYNEKILNAVKEVANTVNTLVTLKNNLKNQSEKLNFASKIFYLTKDRVINGLDTALAQIKTNEAMLKEELTRIDIAQKNLITLIQLIQALGGGFSSEENPQTIRGPHG